jgi:hypothetical protein
MRQRPQLDVHALVPQPRSAPDAVVFALEVAGHRRDGSGTHDSGNG